MLTDLVCYRERLLGGSRHGEKPVGQSAGPQARGSLSSPPGQAESLFPHLCVAAAAADTKQGRLPKSQCSEFLLWLCYIPVMGY